MERNSAACSSSKRVRSRSNSSSSRSRSRVFEDEELKSEPRAASADGHGGDTVDTDVKIWKETKEEKVERDRVFGRAALRARAMVRSKTLLEAETAELMGLFQQATQGDGNNWKILNDPNFFLSSHGLTKNMTWLPLRGMSKMEARDKYIDLVESLTLKYCVIFPLTPASSSTSLASTSSTVSSYLSNYNRHRRHFPTN